MLVNNLNNWFSNNGHHTSQPNFNLSDYQQVDQISDSSKTPHQQTCAKKANYSSCATKNLKQKKLIRNAFHQTSLAGVGGGGGGGAKSKSNMNAVNVSTEKLHGTYGAEFASNTCINLSHHHHDSNTKPKTLISSKFKNNKTQSCLLMNGGVGSNNPFSSNFDLINKNTNSNVTDWTSRFKSRLNTNLSILDYKLCNREAMEAEVNNKSKKNATDQVLLSKNEATNDLEYKNYLKKIFEIFKMNNLNDLNDTGNNNNEAKKNADDSTFSLYYLSTNEKENSEKKATANVHHGGQDEMKNYFLNYRSIVNKKELDSQAKINGDKSANSGMKTVGNLSDKRIENQISKAYCKADVTASLLKNATQLEEHRKRNGPEKFLDSLKLIDIKKWIEQVEQVQNVEGKCLETISKCRFYDD